MDYRERILELVKASPVQPTGLGKILGKDSLMASAMLSEMSSKGLLKISKLKVGSSPLYYSADHPEHLLNYMESMNEKDKRAADLLKEKKVLQDDTLSPLQKVCMRAIKDFALPLEVTLNESKIVFWKWFLTSDEEAGELIKKIVENMSKLEKLEEPEKKIEKQLEKAEPETKIEKEPEKIKEEPKIKPEKPKTKSKKSKVKSKLKKIEPEKEEIIEKEQETEPEIEYKQSEQQIQQPQRTIRPVFVDLGDPFLKKVKAFFDNNNITIHEVNTIKKKTEFDLVIEIPTPLGNLFYFCKAKNNKRISNSDLSSAFVQGQLKKLPVVFLSSGVLTKPAQIFMKDLKGLTVTKL
jgi:outer membrane biosynthesis protein TonB